MDDINSRIFLSLSVSANDLSRLTSGNGGVKTSTATLRMSNSGGRAGTRANANGAAQKSRAGTTASSSLSFMKPTASSTKKFSSVLDGEPSASSTR